MTVEVNDDQGQTWRRSAEVTADGTGNLTDSFNLPNWFVATYAVKATGAGGAIATANFTDSNPQTLTVAAPTSVTVAQGQTATYGDLTMVVGGNNNACSVPLSVASGLPSGATPQFGINPLVTTGANVTTSFSVATTAATAAGTYTFTVTGTRPSSCQGTGNLISNTLTLVVTSACTAPSITSHPANQPITYGDDATFSAAASGNPTPSVQWQASTDSGATWNNLSGETSTTLSLVKPPVSQSGNRYRAVFTNTCGGTQTATSNAATLTVAQKAVTVTADAQSKTYGDPDPTLSYQVTSGSLVTGDSLSGALTRAAGESVAGSPYAIQQGTLAAGSNYNLTFAGANFTITRRRPRSPRTRRARRTARPTRP